MNKNITFHFILSIICLGIYLKGYFPIKQHETFILDPPTHIHNHSFDVTELYKPKIQRLIFVIIDALREDFITPENMPYTYLENRKVLRVKVEAPTVTLPRIKALTTGGIPQFVDIILNLGATTKCEDSFLHRANYSGKKMVFYGDDTWLKMYPDLFVRKDGTTSFFVNDFTEVDDNVTRHLNEEIINNDWDFMFLHYLGLDHIGHVKGPFSTLIKPKLHEMDNIIKTLHQAAKQWDLETLILITGDHGMKDSGGHGGTTYAETHVPLIVFGNFPTKSNNFVQQTDIPTTLSALFAIQIPANSIGKIIPYFFQDYNILSQLYIMYYNLLVLRKGVTACEDNFNVATELHHEVMQDFDEGKSKQVYELYDGCLKEISEKLVQTSVEQNVNYLIFAMVLSVNSLIIIANNLISPTVKFDSNNFVLIVILGTFFISSYSSVLIVLILPSLLTNLWQLIYLVHYNCKFSSFVLYNFPIILHAMLLQSSSFIEEEHQVWYFYTTTITLIITYLVLTKTKLIRILVLLPPISLRFLRRLNSTGDMWASYPDISDWFLLEQNFIYLQIFYLLSLILVQFSLKHFMKTNTKQNFLLSLTLFLTFIFKLFYTNDPTFGKILWLLIASTSIYTFTLKINFLKKLILLWVLTTTLLLRPYNVILIPACFLFSYTYLKHIKNIETLTIIHSWLGYALFFCQGHSNSIASIDLAPAYIGLNSYVPLLVFTFTICHTYTFPILSLLLLFNSRNNQMEKIFSVNIANRLLILIIIFSVTFIQRGHLFVWSVFAPKLLIESVHTIVLFIKFCIFTSIKKVKIYKLLLLTIDLNLRVCLGVVHKAATFFPSG